MQITEKRAARARWRASFFMMLDVMAGSAGDLFWVVVLVQDISKDEGHCHTDDGCYDAVHEVRDGTSEKSSELEECGATCREGVDASACEAAVEASSELPGKPIKW